MGTAGREPGELDRRRPVLQRGGGAGGRGHQLGLVIFGASPDWTLTIDNKATPYSLDLETSSLSLSIVGSLALAGSARNLSQVPIKVPAGTAPGPGAFQLSF